jgi:hypothetical protein
MGGKEERRQEVSLQLRSQPQSGRLTVIEFEEQSLQLSSFKSDIVCGGVRGGVTISDIYLRPHDRRDASAVQLRLLQELDDLVHGRVLGR